MRRRKLEDLTEKISQGAKQETVGWREFFHDKSLDVFLLLGGSKVRLFIQMKKG